MRFLITISCFLAFVNQSFAQPDWEVNANSFSSSMALTGLIRIDGIELKSGNDIVGAFVNGECRGLVKSINVTQINNYRSFLTIYSNQSAGEKVSFKIYDSAIDVVRDAANTITFVADQVLGTLQTPIVIATNNFPTDIDFTIINNAENQLKGTAFAIFTTTDQDAGQTHNYTVLTYENSALFQFSNDTLFVNGPINFEENDTVIIAIESNDGNGGIIKDTFKIAIIDANDNPLLSAQSFEIEENQDQGTFIGTLEISDEDDNQKYHYEIISGNGTGTFALDSMTGDLSVKDPKGLDFEKFPLYELVIKVSDDGSPRLSSTNILSIILLDKDENTVVAKSYFSPNNDGINDYWVIDDLYVFNNFKLIIFNSEKQIVLETSNYQNDWDGTFDGELLPEGVYYYLLRSSDNGKEFNGTISLIR